MTTPGLYTSLFTNYILCPLIARVLWIHIEMTTLDTHPIVYPRCTFLSPGLFEYFSLFTLTLSVDLLSESVVYISRVDSLKLAKLVNSMCMLLITIRRTVTRGPRSEKTHIFAHTRSVQKFVDYFV